jgi:hypothetical protein
MKFLCLAYENERTLNALTREDWDSLRMETLGYIEQLRLSGRLLGAEALKSVTTASTVRVRNGKTVTTDGPFAETKETLGGFFLIEVKNLNEAIEIASRWPSARIGSIEVRPIEPALREEKRYDSASA